MTKVPDAATVSAGASIGFTITVTNEGAGTATAVTLSDLLPTNAGLTWSISNSGNGADCSIASGASKTIHVFGTTNANSCGLMTNTVNVAASNEAESATGNNRAYANVTVA